MDGAGAGSGWLVAVTGFVSVGGEALLTIEALGALVFASTAVFLAMADLNLLSTLRPFSSTAFPLVATGDLLAKVFMAGFAASSDLAGFPRVLVEVFWITGVLLALLD